MGPEWEQAVGRFILALGSIEHTTIHFFGVLPACNFEKAAARISLGQRIEIIDEILAREKDEVHAEALDALRAAAKLLSDRNLVAHNGTIVDIFQDGDRLMLTSHLQSSRNKKVRLSLREMQALAERAQKASVDLGQAWANLALHLDPSLSNPNN